MKMITSIVFEMEMPAEDVEAYNSLSDEDKYNRIEEMKAYLTDVIDSSCVGKTNFTKFNMEFIEGE